jgi:hypothetical protein
VHPVERRHQLLEDAARGVLRKPAILQSLTMTQLMNGSVQCYHVQAHRLTAAVLETSAPPPSIPTDSWKMYASNQAAAAHRAVDVARQVLRQVAAVGVVHDHAQVIICEIRLPHANDVRVPLQPRVVHQLPAAPEEAASENVADCMDAEGGCSAAGQHACMQVAACCGMAWLQILSWDDTCGAQPGAAGVQQTR